MVALAARPGRLAAGPPSLGTSLALERVTFVASAVPGVVIALALVAAAVQWARPIYQTMALVVLAYVILFLPRAVVPWRAGLSTAPPELVGSGPLVGRRAGRRVHPGSDATVAPSAMTGFVLVFLATTTELTATLLLAPTAPRPWPRHSGRPATSSTTSPRPRTRSS